MRSLFGPRSNHPAPPGGVDDSVDVSLVIAELLAQGASFKVSDLASATGLTRQGLHRHIQRALSAGSIVRVGEGRGTRYEAAGGGLDSPDAPASPPPARRPTSPILDLPGSQRFERTDPTEVTAVDGAWQDLAEWMDRLAPGRSEGLNGRVEYTVAQLVGNAVEHSNGDQVRTRAWLDGDRLELEVVDSGVGALERLRSSMRLDDYFHGVQELAKGRATTAPGTHDGEGLFFASKLGTRFQLNANGLSWIVNNELDDQTVVEDPSGPGTRVRVRFDLHSVRTLGDVVDRFKSGGVMDRTTCAVRLFEHGAEFFTRGQAQRIALHLERFKVVELDFKSVESVGQAFVEALFRDWASAHPNTELRPVNMSSSVGFMVHRGLPPA